MNIISLGGGVQSSALVILTAQGKIDDPATHAVFADTGGEMPETLEWIQRLAEWSEANGGPEVVIVRKDGPGLYDHHFATADPVSSRIPMRGSRGAPVIPRDCTKRWKIEVVEKWVTDHRRNGKSGVHQLGISYDELHRMRNSSNAGYSLRYPLVELKMRREDCRRVFFKVGLSVPARSACFFCPYRNVGYWEYLAADRPDLLEKAALLEDRVNEWTAQNKKDPLYLSSRGRPLREAFPPGQMVLWPSNGEAEECGGYCFA